MATDISSLKRAEECKRNRAWNSRERWKAMQNAIAWAESQTTARRNTPAACLRRERALLAGLRSTRSP